MTDFPPLTEAEVRAEKARHEKGVAGNYCRSCGAEWPCPTIRLIAEREQLRQVGKLVLPELEGFMAGEQCDHSVGICYCSAFIAVDELKAALAETGEKELESPALQASVQSIIKRSNQWQGRAEAAEARIRAADRLAEAVEGFHCLCDVDECRCGEKLDAALAAYQETAKSPAG